MGSVTDQGTEETGGPDSGTWRSGLWAPAFAFTGSGCLLVLELVAARMIAPEMGVSLYTWTSVIGVVLAGVSLGNFLGGRIGDRWPTRAALGWVYLAGSAVTALVLVLSHFIGDFKLPYRAPAVVQVLWVAAVLFFVPSTVLGAPTPILTRLSLRSVDGSARVVGRIQAAAALGSITGTFLTGFGLIAWFGVRHVVAGVAAVLLLLALLAGLPRTRSAAGAAFAVLVGIGAAAASSSSPCTRESNYFCIRVAPEPVTAGDRPVGAPAPQSLYLDHLLHSTIDPADPTNLGYGYEQEYARLVDALWPQGRPFDSFFVGGGGFVFPRYLDRRGSGRIVVSEIDPEVTKIARERLGLAPSERMRIIDDDARRVLARMPADEKYDAIFGDAFNDYAVPYHLTTREFHRLVADHLNPGGVYAMNLVDGADHALLRSEIATLRRTFDHVAVVIPRTGWPPLPDRDTFVVLASDRPLPSGLGLVPAEGLEPFMGAGRTEILTDDYAPVDQMLAPVFSRAIRRPDF